MFNKLDVNILLSHSNGDKQMLINTYQEHWKEEFITEVKFSWNITGLIVSLQLNEGIPCKIV